MADLAQPLDENVETNNQRRVQFNTPPEGINSPSKDHDGHPTKPSTAVSPQVWRVQNTSTIPVGATFGVTQQRRRIVHSFRNPSFVGIDPARDHWYARNATGVRDAPLYTVVTEKDRVQIIVE